MEPGKNYSGGAKPYDPIAPQPPGELNEWQTGLCSTCCKYPGEYMFSCFCTPCAVYKQREKILQGNWDDYVCCNGICFGDKIPMQHDCPSCCMWCEALCCINCAVAGNRNYLLDKYWIKDSCLEKIFLYCCAGPRTADVSGPNPMKCICGVCRCIAKQTPCGDCCSCLDPEKCCGDNIQCTCCYDCVSACFITQQNVEIKIRDYPGDAVFEKGPYAATEAAADQFQQPGAFGAPGMGGQPGYQAAPQPGYQAAPQPQGYPEEQGYQQGYQQPPPQHQ